MLRLATSYIDILKQVLWGWLRDWHILCLGDLAVDCGTGLLIDGLELVLGCDVPLDEFLLEPSDGILGGSHTLDLLAGSVGGSWVRHGVASVSVGDVFEDDRTVAGCGVLAGVLDCCLYGEDVHSVDLETRDVLTTLVVVCEGGRAVGCGTHTVFVVWIVSIIQNAGKARETHSRIRIGLGGSTA